MEWFEAGECLGVLHRGQCGSPDDNATGRWVISNARSKAVINSYFLILKCLFISIFDFKVLFQGSRSLNLPEDCPPPPPHSHLLCPLATVR